MIDGPEKTKLYCTVCGRFHDARLVDREGSVFWRLECPTGERDIRISSDSRLFSFFRSQTKPVPKWFRRSLSNCIIHINDDCSLHCPICFEDAGRTGWRMSLEEVRAAAAKIKATGAVNVMLIGGEPADHPQLLDIIRCLSREWGFRCSMLTNGVRMGREKGFVEALKKAGLAKASISFDTFKPEVSKIIRGDGNLIQVKLCAAEECFKAGLACGFVVTACRLNLCEIPDIIAYFVAHAAHMTMLEIQCFQDAGRTVPGLESVDREEIVREIIASGVIPGLDERDFRISPQVPAAGFCIHPDCGGGLFWTVRGGRAVPLTHDYPFDAFLQDLYEMPKGGRTVKWLRFLFAAVRRMGFGILPVLRAWVGFGKPGRNTLQLLSISTLMTPERLDSMRFCRCTNGVLTHRGSFCSPCYYYCMRFDEERRSRA